ncbi:unnamed protein product, partial [marine sediment metagenome]
MINVSPQMRYEYLSWGDFNPINWIETAADWVYEGGKFIYKGAAAAGAKIWDGVKWVRGKIFDPCTY